MDRGSGAPLGSGQLQWRPCRRVRRGPKAVDIPELQVPDDDWWGVDFGEFDSKLCPSDAALNLSYQPKWDPALLGKRAGDGGRPRTSTQIGEALGVMAQNAAGLPCRYGEKARCYFSGNNGGERPGGR